MKTKNISAVKEKFYRQGNEFNFKREILRTKHWHKQAADRRAYLLHLIPKS